jgi:hypothetical protein
MLSFVGPALVQGSIYGFDIPSGAMTLCFPKLHSMPISSIVYAPASEVIITATLDEGVTASVFAVC